jgi:phospholipid-binding lipoprotein MlaA
MTANSMRRQTLKIRGWYLKVGLISFLMFIFLTSPIMTGQSGFKMVLASAEQTAAPQEDQNEQKVYDPYERNNRRVFDFNDRFYFHVLKPVAKGYSVIFSSRLREAIRNGFHNLVFPSRFINFVLQAKADRATSEAVRFVINSTLGLAGLFDFAQTHFKLENRESDFGQTLAIWGVGSGAFLIIPVLGPSNERDFSGFLVDSVMDPLFWIPAAWWVSVSAQTGKIVNHTSLQIGQYEELKKASLDPYIAMRDAYIQYRAHTLE